MTIRQCRAFVVGVALLVVPSLADAATQRTFVSVSGTSNPNCSLAAPCRSFAEAIGATNAGGEIIVLDSGGYGPVTVTKSVSIIAPPGIYAGVSVFSGNGITVNAPGATVVLRGLSINGQGGLHGIVVQQAARLRIENCDVSRMGGNGIYHAAANAELVVAGTVSHDNGDGGIAIAASGASILLDHVRIEHNQSVGVYVAPISVGADVHVNIVDGLVARNGSHGIWADTIGSTNTELRVVRTVVTSNAAAGLYASAGASDSTGLIYVDGSVLRDQQSGDIALLATFGQVQATVVGTAFDGVSADGSQVSVLIGGSSGFVNCHNGARIFTYQDNHTPLPGACSVSPLSPH